jgi:hypothetical protein
MNITLRDHFAGLAMQGILSNSDVMNSDAISKDAYTTADSMIKERWKTMLENLEERNKHMKGDQGIVNPDELKERMEHQTGATMWGPDS